MPQSGKGQTQHLRSGQVSCKCRPETRLCQLRDGLRQALRDLQPTCRKLNIAADWPTCWAAAHVPAPSNWQAPARTGAQRRAKRQACLAPSSGSALPPRACSAWRPDTKVSESARAGRAGRHFAGRLSSTARRRTPGAQPHLPYSIQRRLDRGKCGPGRLPSVPALGQAAAGSSHAFGPMLKGAPSRERSRVSVAEKTFVITSPGCSGILGWETYAR